MCIIIIKQQKDKKVHKQTLKNSSRINPHGLGVVWLDTFEVTYHKSNEYAILHTERPFIAHFRYATIGKVNRENTHPFVCGNNSDELLMMNGTIRNLGNDTMCDSKVLAHSLGRVKRQNWKSELAKYDCRFTTINTRTRTFQIYNKELWTKKNGVWYSKPNVLMDNLVAVYGTLKKGYNNYNSYLRRSVYLGGGVTTDKYPLIIRGLPYMVNQKGMGHNVEVDVFKVSDEVLENLDRLEGHPKWYKREEVEINVKGKVLSCWVYFNPIDISGAIEFHKTYTQQTSIPSYTPTDYDWSQHTFDFDDDDDDSSMIVEDGKPYCVECFNELENDGYDNYCCKGCHSWYTQNQINNLNY